MQLHTWLMPLREDFNFRLIISEGDDTEEILDLIGDTDEEYVRNNDGWSEFDGENFTIVIIKGGLPTLVHECDHVAFDYCKKFSIHDKEVHCMMVEWCFTKSMEFVK